MMSIAGSGSAAGPKPWKHQLRQPTLIVPALPEAGSAPSDMKGNADAARAAGIKAFAMKPLTKKEIAKTIRQVLSQ